LTKNCCFTAFSAITAAFSAFIFSSSAIPVASSANTLASLILFHFFLVCDISYDNNDSQDIP
jgi:hypothetical protein